MGYQIQTIRTSIKLWGVFFLIFLFNLSAYSSKPPKWFVNLQRVKLLETKRAEVEKIFGNPKTTYDFDGNSTGLVIEYEIGVGRVSAVYSYGKCVKGSNYGYNVEKDVVTEIEISLNKEVRISSLGLDLSEFYRNEVSDVIGLFTYSNSDGSKRFTGSTTKINDFSLHPTEKQEEISCRNLNK